MITSESMHHNITIKDLAKKLNISVATVSRAMRNTHDVSEATRSKVLALAAELNYKPNYNATGLAQRRTHNIGIVLPFITNYYFSTVITGIQEVAYNNNYNIILFITNDSPEREIAIIDNLTLSGLDGLLVSVSSDDSGHFQAVMDKGIPIVFFDRVPAKIKTSKVMQDDFNGAFEAVEHLIKNGYRRIAHLAGPRGLDFTEKRLEGFVSALKKYNVPFYEEYVIYSGFSQECGEEDTRKLLKLPKRPDAIFAINDRKAIGAMIALKKRGVIVGKEIGVVGFTNDPMSSLISPSLTTIAEPAFEIGKESCHLLLKHIKKRNFIAEQKVLPGKLIVRESSRKK